MFLNNCSSNCTCFLKMKFCRNKQYWNTHKHKKAQLKILNNQDRRPLLAAMRPNIIIAAKVSAYTRRKRAQYANKIIITIFCLLFTSIALFHLYGDISYQIKTVKAGKNCSNDVNFTQRLWKKFTTQRKYTIWILR